MNLCSLFAIVFVSDSRAKIAIRQLLLMNSFVHVMVCNVLNIYGFSQILDIIRSFLVNARQIRIDYGVLLVNVFTHLKKGYYHVAFGARKFELLSSKSHHLSFKQRLLSGSIWTAQIRTVVIRISLFPFADVEAILSKWCYSMFVIPFFANQSQCSVAFVDNL